jgi:hypothetical protein
LVGCVFQQTHFNQYSWPFRAFLFLHQKIALVEGLASAALSGPRLSYLLPFQMQPLADVL